MFRHTIWCGALLLCWQFGISDAAYAASQSTDKVTPKIEQKDQQLAKETFVKIVDVTNLRKGAGLEFEIVGKAKPGESYPVLGSKGDWYNVSLPDGGTAYVANWVVKTENTRSCGKSGVTILANAAPKADSAKQSQAKEMTVKIVDNTNLRIGPGLDQDIIAKAKAGDELPVIGSEGDWYQVQLPGGKKAFVANWVVKTETKSRTESPPASASVKPVCQGSVYIYHTHNLESWKNVAGLTHGTSYDDPKVNITLVGEHIGQQLQAKGISTIVGEDDFAEILKARNLSFGQSYAESRKAVNQIKESHPDLTYFFDIHRDADVPRDKTTATISGLQYARILFVIGTGHPNYKENKQFAESLNERLNKKYPGLSRGVILKSAQQGNGEYNQSVSPGSLLLEVGGVNNTLQESLRTASAFADVFAEYYVSTK
ncbi:stage II sporulation protein P [Paenibacillus puerhi]|uniref:stage II sporulation protein P n=1 Tax=Paenibacillus puerhi TaxID=2692622 RepID=UPI00135C6260|nr:stage II sporulation protein P [Paenibacillus puerhi]